MIRDFCRRLWTALILVMPGACERANVPDQLTILLDSADVHISRSDGPTTVTEFRRSPSFRIGVANGDSNYELSRVVGAVHLADGSIVVANAGTSELRFYNPDGVHRLTVGRSGDGPGEFRRMESLVAGLDSLYVFDSRLLRISAYDLEGTFRGVRSLQGTPSDGVPLDWYRLLAVTEQGEFIFVPKAYPVRESSEKVARWHATPNRLYDSSGRFVRTVGEDSGVEMAGMIPILFNRASASTFADGRLFITDGRTYEVRAYDLDGRLTEIFRLDRTPRRVTQEVRHAYTETILDEARESGRAEIRSHLEQAIITPFMPSIQDMHVDPNGNLWLGEFWEFWRPMAATRDWLVVDREGRWSRTLRLAGNLRIFQVEMDYLVATSQDRFGVEYVFLYPLEGND